jgi:hypothetical protein
MTGKTAKADDAPVTTAGVETDASEGGSEVIPATVTGFSDIGQFTLTMCFDTTRVHFVSASTNPVLTGMTVTYHSPEGNTQGKLIFAWTGTSNVSLVDGSTLADLTFTYITGTGILSWTYMFGAVCQYQRYVNGSLTLLNDNPRYLFYLNGGISNRGAPVTFAPNIADPVPGPLPVPITVNDFVTIGALTLYLEYDPDIITYQGSFTKNPAFGSSFLVGDIAGNGGNRLIVIQWYGTEVNLDDESILCTLDFTYSTANGTYTALNWFDNGPSCEYADGDCNVLIDMPSGDYYKNGLIGSVLFDIIIHANDNCGEFEVKLLSLNTLDTTLTEIIFTVKWEVTTTSDIELKDINAYWPDLQMVGNREEAGGYYHVTFSSSSNYMVSWSSGVEYTIMTFRHTGTGEGECDFTIISEDYGSEPPGANTAFYVEVNSYDATGNIYNNADDVSLNCGVHLKDFLQGPYDVNTHLMLTDLAAGNYLVMQQPYTTSPWQYDGAEQITSYPEGVVDWVLIELRTGIAASSMVGRRAGLLMSNGSIVDTNGSSPLVFHSFSPGSSYYVVVYHRSHIPVMTSTAITLPNNALTYHDFTTNPSLKVYSVSNAAVILLEEGIYGHIAGDIFYNNNLQYSGPNNDRGLIFAKIAELFNPPPATLNSTVSGYYKEDLNLDGMVKYSGPQNDQGIIFYNIDWLTDPTMLTTIYLGQVPVDY